MKIYKVKNIKNDVYNKLIYNIYATTMKYMHEM